MPAFDLPKFDMPKFDMPKFDLPKVDISAMGTQTRERMSDAAQSVRGNVSHTVTLIREAVGA